MAYRGATLQNTNGTEVISLAKPAGTVDGDVAYMWVIFDNVTSGVTWPTGFVALGSVSPLTTNVLDAQRMHSARKVCSGEPATWTGASDDFSPMKCGVAVFSGRDTTTPEHRQSGLADTTSRASPWTATSSAFASNTTLSDCDILFIEGDDQNGTNDVSHTPPSGFTLVGEHTGTTFFQGAAYYKAGAAAGETGVYAATGTAAGRSTNLAIVAIAIAGNVIPPLPRGPRSFAVQQRAA